MNFASTVFAFAAVFAAPIFIELMLIAVFAAVGFVERIVTRRSLILTLLSVLMAVAYVWRQIELDFEKTRAAHEAKILELYAEIDLGWKKFSDCKKARV